MMGNQSWGGMEDVEDEAAGRSNAESIVCGLVLSLLTLTAVCGNMAVIYAVFRFSKLRDQVSNLLLVNLAITDLLSSILVMAVSDYLIYADLREVEATLCQLQCAANYCLIIVSMVTLACISLDRYIAVLWPLRYNNVVTRRRVLMLMCWPWLQGMLFAAAPVWMGWVHYDYWEAVCAIDWEGGGGQVQIYVIIACILCFLVPGGIMVFCYVHIIKQARHCHKHIHPMPQSTNISSNFKQALKTITSLLVVVVVFFVCMTPFCLTKLLKVVISTNYVPGYVNLASSYLEYFASVANPFIYGIFRRDFRFAYRHLLWYLSCKLSNISPGSFQDSIDTINYKPPGRVSNYTMTQRKPRNGEVAIKEPSPLPFSDSAENLRQQSSETRTKQPSAVCSVSSVQGQFTLPANNTAPYTLEMLSLPEVQIDHLPETAKENGVVRRLRVATFTKRRTQSAGSYSATGTPVCNGTDQTSNGRENVFQSEQPVEFSIFSVQSPEKRCGENGHV